MCSPVSLHWPGVLKALQPVPGLQLHITRCDAFGFILRTVQQNVSTAGNPLSTIVGKVVDMQHSYSNSSKLHIHNVNAAVVNSQDADATVVLSQHSKRYSTGKPACHCCNQDTGATQLYRQHGHHLHSTRLPPSWHNQQLPRRPWTPQSSSNVGLRKENFWDVLAFPTDIRPHSCRMHQQCPNQYSNRNTPLRLRTQSLLSFLCVPLQPQLVGAPARTFSSSPPVNEDRLYTGPTYMTEYVGPVTVQHFPGKGRGLVANQDLQQGRLIMAIQPLGILLGPEGEQPDADQLADTLHSTLPQLSPKQLQQLQEMDHGLSESSSNPGSVDVDRVVSTNAFGCVYDDPASAMLKGSEVSSCVGLWPRFNLLNHSCRPNCINYTLGSTMVVRLVEDVRAGSELTISYLGREEFLPVAERQRLLSERYGFKCQCPRCLLEMSLPEPDRALMAQVQQGAERRLNEVSTLLEGQFEGQADDKEVGKVDILGPQLSELQPALLNLLTRVKQQPTGTKATMATPPAGRLNEQEASPKSTRAEQNSQWVSGGSEAHKVQAHAKHMQQALNDKHGTCSVQEAGARTSVDQGAAQPSLESLQSEQTQGNEHEVLTGDVAVLCFEASMYTFFELLYLQEHLSDSQSDAAVAMLRLCSQIVDASCRGSELHCFQTARLLALELQKQGSMELDTGDVIGSLQKITQGLPEGLLEAAEACRQAHVARYGHVSSAVMQRLVQANMVLSEQYM